MPSHHRHSVWALAAGVLLASQVFAADVPISEKARAHFRAGVSYLQDPDGARYEEAFNEFRAAYQDSPSWKILGNLGVTAYKLERDGEALDAMKKYLEEGGANIPAEERPQFERDVATLQAGVVRITLESDPPGANITDERLRSTGTPVVNGYGTLDQSTVIGVRAGRHQITARLAGYKDSVWTVDAASGSTHSHKFVLEKEGAAAPAPTGPAPAPTTAPTATEAPPVLERPVPTAVWIGAAATGVFAIGAGVTGFMAMGKNSEYGDANDGSDPAAAETLKKDGESLNLIADVFLGGAVIAGGITAVLYFSRPEVAVEQDQGRLRVQPLVGPRAGGLSLSGSF